MNLTCEEFVDLMLDYVGGELPEEQVEAIKTHLCGCKHCTDRHTTYTFTILMTRTLAKCDPLPPELEARLRQKLAAAATGGGES